ASQPGEAADRADRLRRWLAEGGHTALLAELCPGPEPAPAGVILVAAAVGRPPDRAEAWLGESSAAVVLTAGAGGAYLAVAERRPLFLAPADGPIQALGLALLGAHACLE